MQLVDTPCARRHLTQLRWCQLFYERDADGIPRGSVAIYRGTVPAKVSGLRGYSVRVLPCYDDLLVPDECCP
jgi:hypothetical protein